MKSYLNNTLYFLRETKTVIKLNWLSNISSIFSTALIFFILTMIISAWWISSEVVQGIQNEAEISVYLYENIESEEIAEIVKDINIIDGVEEARLVNEDEAYDRMVEILGKEARVLEFFDDNPFNFFIEVGINLHQIDPVLEKLNTIGQIDHVRDNREILNRISNISKVLKALGYLVVAAAGITTIVIISHIIRLGIYNDREQINTLRLLGAPEFFIALPYLLEGMLLTLAGGILSTILSVFIVEYVYAQITGPVPFIPLPAKDTLVFSIVVFVTLLSGTLGTSGSLIGLSSAKKE